MEDSNNEPHPDYIKGFNEGYMMAKYMPELTEKIGKNLGKSERSMGFSDGKSQYALERDEERYPNWRRKDWNERLDNGQGPEKGKNKDWLDR